MRARLLVLLLLPLGTPAPGQGRLIEVDLMCPVAEIAKPGGAGDMEVTIGRGSDDGIAVGVRGDIYSGREGGASGIDKVVGRGEVVAVEAATSRVRLLPGPGTMPEAIQPGAQVSLPALVPSDVHQGILFRLYTDGIVFLDNYKDPIVAAKELMSARTDEVEKATLVKMQEAVRECAEFCGELKETMTRPQFRGRSVQKIMEDAREEDITAFLRFVEAYPGKYIGKDWKVSETLATWLINDAPPAPTDLLREMLAIPAGPAFDEAAKNLNERNTNELFEYVCKQQAAWPLPKPEVRKAQIDLLDRVAAARGEMGPKARANHWNARGRYFGAITGQETPAVEAFRKAAALFIEIGDPLEGLVSLNNVVSNLYDAERFDETLTAIDELRAAADRELAKTTNPQTAAHIPLRVAYANATAARIANKRGDYKKVVETLTPLIGRYAATGFSGAREREIETLEEIAKARRKLGDVEDAWATYERMEVLAGEMRNLSKQASIAFDMGDTRYEKGRYEEALVQYERCADLARRASDKGELARGLAAGGQALWSLGRCAEALAMHEAGMAPREETGDRSGLAWQLLQMGKIRRDMGDRVEAAKLLERALAIRQELGQKASEAEVRKELGELRLALSNPDAAEEQFAATRDLYAGLKMVPDEATAIEGIARACLLRKDLAAAEEHVTRAIALRETIPDPVELACTYIWQGSIRDSLQKRALARESYQRALDLAKEDAGVRSEALSNLSASAVADGDLDTGAKHADAALALAEQSKDVRRRLTALDRRRCVWVQIGTFDRALELVELQITLARESGNRPSLVDALQQKAWLLCDLGRLSEGRAVIEEALPLAENNGDPVQKAWSLNTLAKVAGDLGDVREELRCYDEGIPLMHGGGYAYGEAALRFNRSLVLIRMRDLDGALEEQGRARELAGKGMTAELDIALIGGRGHALLLKGAYGDAETCLREGLAKVGKSRRRIDLLGKLAETLSVTGKPDAALALLDEAVAIEAELPGEQYAALADRGIALARAGKDEEARKTLGEVVRRAEGRGGTLPWDALMWLGTVESRGGRPDEALAALERAAKEIERGETVLGDDKARARYRSDKMDAYRMLIKLLLGKGRVEDALVYLERAKVAELNEVDRRGGAGKDPTAAVRAELEVQESKLQELLNAERNNPEKKKRIRELLNDVRKKRGAFIESLNKNDALYDSYSVRPMDLEKLQEHLADGMLVLSPIVLDDRVVVFAVTRKAITHFDATVTAEEVSALSDAFLKEVDPGRLTRGLDLPRGEEGVRSIPASLERIKVPARKLYDLLLRPAFDALGVPRTLIVSASGTLRYLPFGAFLDGETWALEKMAIVHVTTLDREKFSAGGGAGGAKPTVLALADPDGSLPGARKEVDAIQKVFEGAIVFVGDKATRETLEDEVSDPGYEVVHLATHGLLDAANPELSKILLAGEPLFYNDIKTLSFAHTRLLVLSACQTAVRTGATGVEIAGLAYQFQRTRVQSVLATLWPVDDQATSQLMGSFYAQLHEGKTYALALAEAQRALIRGADEKRRHPAFWAPFVLMGTP